MLIGEFDAAPEDLQLFGTASDPVSGPILVDLYERILTVL
jgi:hypothetical protein